MGVSNLWGILQSCGNPIKPESLEGKILAIDISIWLHQALHGYVNTSLSNNKPHLHLIINRIFKLLHYKIKPVFVFDGGVPVLKRRTMLTRQEKRNNASVDIDKLNRQIVKNKLWEDILKKYMGIENNLSKNNIKIEDKDIFELPYNESPNAISDKDIEWEKRKHNIIQAINHLSQSDNIDIDSKSFKILPKGIQHEILQELQYSNKHPTLEKLIDLTDKIQEFSDFQINRLVKRSQVTDRIENLNRQMNVEYISKITSSNPMNSNDKNYVMNNSLSLEELSNAEIQRMASDETVHYVLVRRKNVNVHADRINLPDKNRLGYTSKPESKDDQNEATMFDIDDDDEYICQINEMIEQSKTSTNYVVTNNLLLDVQENGVQFADVANDYKDNKIMGEEMGDSILKLEQTRLLLNHRIFEANTSAVDSLSEIDANILPLEFKGNHHPKHNPSSKDREFVGGNNIEYSKKNMASKNLSHKNYFSKSSKRKKREAVAKNQYSPINQLRHKYSSRTPSKFSYFSLKSIKRKIIMGRIKKVPSKIHERKGYVPRPTFLKVDSNKLSIDINRNDKIANGNVNFWPEAPLITPLSLNMTQSHNAKLYDDSTLKTIAKYNLTPPEDVFENNSILKEIKNKLERQHVEALDDVQTLNIERAKLERYSKTLTQVIYQETQELLKILGVPWVVAPMEAEAQCAYMDITGLTHGTITDDSDVFLFGARRVYRNFYATSLNKGLEFYSSQDMERKLGLDRQKLIMIAMMVGSDYTPGIKGVGPVMALEILSEFQIHTFQDFIDFKKWLDSSRHHLSSLHKSLKIKSPLLPASLESPLKRKLLDKNIYFPDEFPEPLVFEAYMNPSLETSQEGFTWGHLNAIWGVKMDGSTKLDKGLNNEVGTDATTGNKVYLDLLNFVKKHINWDANKLDSYLNPLRKRLALEKNKIQHTIDEYYTPVYNDTCYDANIPENKTMPNKRILKALTKLRAKNKAEEPDKKELNRKKITKKSAVKRATGQEPGVKNLAKNKAKTGGSDPDKPVTCRPRNKGKKKKLKFSNPALANDFALNLSEESS
ncbi:DNA excision repair protein ERCC-5 homolog isoform X2 [Gordionus sp. m RMFG-2023]|uniref:DNA excision repair protein ERCC-5 homolog isoform X2 n=1 Tax=Gordionus sp. m RMFG-2023 TaxID=3053472 RepID=UPI0031FD10BF